MLKLICGLLLLIFIINVKSYASQVEKRDIGFGFPSDEHTQKNSVHFL